MRKAWFFAALMFLSFGCAKRSGPAAPAEPPSAPPIEAAENPMNGACPMHHGDGRCPAHEGACPMMDGGVCPMMGDAGECTCPMMQNDAGAIPPPPPEQGSDG